MHTLKPQNSYFWRELKVGDSHYKHKRKIQQVRDAWCNFKRNNPFARKWVVEFFEKEFGVLYRRIE